MKKIFWMIQLAALSAGMQAFGIVGGPFDNGDGGILMDRGGYYEASFTYQNGNGYATWTSDNLVGTVSTGTTVTPNYSAGSLLTPGSGLALSEHNANRSVLYYKGVAYVGNAWGQVDIDGREIQGFCNAFSDLDSTTAGQASSSGALIGTTQVFSLSTAVVASGRGYVANMGWAGEIIDTAPQLEFVGEGELAIIAPNGSETMAGLAYTGYAGLIDAINQSVASGTDITVTNSLVGTLDIYGGASAAIQSALADLQPYLAGTGPSNGYEESEIQRVDVEGIRRYY